MTDRFRAGEPAWIEVSSTDPEGAEAFYTDLLGWSVRHERLGSGVYRMCSVDGRDVAGIAEAGLVHDGRPHGWITYFAVDDVDRSLTRAVELGAETLSTPRYLPAAGTGCVLVDPQGAVFGVYAGESRAGVEAANTAGSLCWTELSTGEPDASVAFYRGLFGYGTDVRHSPTGRSYTVLTLDDAPVAGILELESQWPNTLPARWAPYLGVTDLERSVDRVVSLGGSQAIGPVQSPNGALHVVRDAEGHTFDLIELETGLWISPRLSDARDRTSTQVSDA